MDLKSVLSAAWGRIYVPPNTEVTVTFGGDIILKSILTLAKTDAFNLEITFSQSRWNIGLPLLIPYVTSIGVSILQ